MDPGVYAEDDNAYFDLNDGYPDLDGDGLSDCIALPNGDAFPLDEYNWYDTDGDSIGDQNDTDDDNDGVYDDSDAFPDDDSESLDTDSDGIGNNADTDDDNDGL